MIIDTLREAIKELPDEFTTWQAVRAVNRMRMEKGKHPILRGKIKRDLFKLVSKKEIEEAKFNYWRK